ncbi:MAG: hypothetical protein GWP34_01700 [Alphaproteobacteria bacterium]|nr:hypothetical protein [Alphaproteobacteria bacterium]
MARAQRLASRFETLSVSAAKLRQNLTLSFYRSPFGRGLWRGANEPTLFDYPNALRPGHGLRGESWLAGDYSLPGGMMRAPGQSPFEIIPPTTQWRNSLHSFDWLPDLLAVANGGGHQAARAAILHWALAAYVHQRATMRPALVGRRLMRWAQALSEVRSGFDGHALAAIHTSFSTQTHWLERLATQCDDGIDRLHAALGLTLAACALPQQGQILRYGMDLLSREIRRQILPDGGHASRNPALLADLLADLMALEAVLKARQVELPSAIATARDRMQTLLAMLRHKDGHLAVFQGGLESHVGNLDAVLGPGRAKTSKPISFAQKSGYQRLEAGNSCVLIDVGEPPRGTHSIATHAAPLAFEMSHGGDRLIVNCGPNLVHGADWQLAARGLAAHSTLAFDANVADPFLRTGIGARRLGPRVTGDGWHVTNRRVEDKSGIWLETSHAIFLETHGVRHNRRFFIDAAGEDIRGEDLLLADMSHMAREGAAFHLRFHLHPKVKASLQGRGDAILLLTPAGHGWQFRLASDATGDLRIEDSVYMGQNGVPQRCQQITVQGRLAHGDTLMRWALRYAGHQTGRRTRR